MSLGRGEGSQKGPCEASVDRALELTSQDGEVRDQWRRRKGKEGREMAFRLLERIVSEYLV